MSVPGRLPHDGVVARLGVSPRHGVGVFAIAPIAAGADVFAGDDRAIRWIAAAAADALPAGSAARAFYVDFGIRRGDRIGCPAHFDQLSVGWYVNEPAAGESPNVFATCDYSLIAARDIAAGEELTVRYATFSEVRQEK